MLLKIIAFMAFMNPLKLLWFSWIWVGGDTTCGGGDDDDGETTCRL